MDLFLPRNATSSSSQAFLGLMSVSVADRVICEHDPPARPKLMLTDHQKGAGKSNISTGS